TCVTMASMGVFDPTEPDVAAVLDGWGRSGPGYLGLAHAMRSAILDGRLPLRARLPSERSLARSLGVSRTTTTAAYDVLRSEGFVESRRGSGTRTALPTGGSAGAEVAPRVIAPEPFDGIDLTTASLPAPSAMVEAVAQAARDLPSHLGGHGYDP